ncbi:MAG: hypothetical protein PPFGHCPK_00159 [Spiroplasma endosymbiont of Drosophila atripex]|nr:MAG: hypothetical protein PPFGHCPK_00159 [Spiroplasma endosymbiont of Drosophila atripex]
MNYKLQNLILEKGLWTLFLLFSFWIGSELVNYYSSGNFFILGKILILGSLFEQTLNSLKSSFLFSILTWFWVFFIVNFSSLKLILLLLFVIKIFNNKNKRRK